jgi:hypothetical protein
MPILHCYGFCAAGIGFAGSVFGVAGAGFGGAGGCSGTFRTNKQNLRS